MIRLSIVFIKIYSIKIFDLIKNVNFFIKKCIFFLFFLLRERNITFNVRTWIILFSADIICILRLTQNYIVDTSSFPLYIDNILTKSEKYSILLCWHFILFFLFYSIILTFLVIAYYYKLILWIFLLLLISPKGLYSFSLWKDK